MKVIRQEMALFENGGNLKLVYDYLLSIPPHVWRLNERFQLPARSVPDYEPVWGMRHWMHCAFFGRFSRSNS